MINGYRFISPKPTSGPTSYRRLGRSLCNYTSQYISIMGLLGYIIYIYIHIYGLHFGGFSNDGWGVARLWKTTFSASMMSLAVLASSPLMLRNNQLPSTWYLPGLPARSASHEWLTGSDTQAMSSCRSYRRRFGSLGSFTRPQSLE